MFFDARSAKTLKQGEHIVVQGCPGLRLEATASTKSWTYRYRSLADSAKLKQVKLGQWPAMSPAQAAAEWQAARDLREQGRDPADERKLARKALAQPVAQVYTLARLVDDYAARYLMVNREAKGARNIEQRLRNAISGRESTSVAEVGRSFVYDVIEGLADRPVLAKSVKTEMAAAWRVGLESGRIPDGMPNWWAERTSHKLRSKGAVRDGKHKGTSKRVLSGAEIKTLIGGELSMFSQQVRDFLTLQLWTCTRGGEICQMQKKQLSEEGGVLWWTVPKEAMKIRHVEVAHDLRVPLFGRAEQIVQRLLANEGQWLFPSIGRDGVLKGQTQAYMQTKVHYLQPYSKTKPEHKRARLTVTHWSPHDLRRTGRTILASMGCPHEVGEAILGHVLPGVAGDYNLYRYDAERGQWLAALDAKLEEFIGA